MRDTMGSSKQRAVYRPLMSCHPPSSDRDDKSKRLQIEFGPTKSAFLPTGTARLLTPTANAVNVFQRCSHVFRVVMASRRLSRPPPRLRGKGKSDCAGARGYEMDAGPGKIIALEKSH